MAKKLQRVKVDRSFYVQGERQGVNSVIDIPFPLARELSGARKCHFVQADTELVSTNEETPTTDATLPDKDPQAISDRPPVEQREPEPEKKGKK